MIVIKGDIQIGIRAKIRIPNMMSEDQLRNRISLAETYLNNIVTKAVDTGLSALNIGIRILDSRCKINAVVTKEEF